MAERFRAGGRLFTFGNGGSSTDAAGVAALFACPPVGTALPARSLVDDTAVLTAVGNDIGFDLVFVRQLIAHSRAGDITLGLSTSGNSRNLLAAFAEARQRGLLTVGIAGYDGGAMADAGLDHCLVVRSDSVHRTQETQAALGFALWTAVHARLTERTSHD
jgi:D-sedoheptulose 7-phosphate isomerase